MSIGDSLAAARRQSGLSITQVSQRTCIRETIVRGIERDDYSACGGDFYARGHIRSIARTVGLDPEELVREYDSTHSPPRPIAAKDVFQPYTPVKVRERRRPNWTLALLAVLVIALGAAAIGYFTSRGHASPNGSNADASQHHAAKGATKPKASTSPAATSHATTPASLVLSIRAHPGQYSWVQLTSASGLLIFQGDIGPGGAARTWRETHTTLVVIGNPMGVTLTVDGRQHSHLGPAVLRLRCTRGGCRT